MCMRVGRVPFKGMCLDQGFTKNKHQALEKKKNILSKKNCFLIFFAIIYSVGAVNEQIQN